MAMDRHVTLTYRNRILAFPASATLYIGQTEGCDLRLPNHTQYEDEIFAKISRDSNGNGWHLVRLTQYYPLYVNGHPVNRVHYLSDGDVIEIPGNIIRFKVREGEQTTATVTHVHSSRKALAAIGAAIAIGFGLVGYQLYDAQKERLTSSMKQEIISSLFTTRVDSLHLMSGDSVAASYIYASGPVGTAFLTTDSLIVTARHCIQPWLNTVAPHDYGRLSGMTDWPVQKALYVETLNQLSGEDSLRLVSYITLTDESGRTIALSSDDFAINTLSDDIVELGSYDTPLYWRSISHRYTRRDMMLGDIAVAKTDKEGAIHLADSLDLINLLAHRGVTLTFAGYPASGVTGNRLDFKTDELRLPLEEMPEAPGRYFMLAHEGALTPGFSGGPVIVRGGLGYKAVGVISVVDERNGNRSYSVPVSEIKH